MKFLRAALVVAMALCLTASVYAETQSVKVSGDLTVRGIARSNYDYRSSTPETGTIVVGGVPVGVPRTGMMADPGGMTGLANSTPGTPQGWWMSTTEVQIDADLTDCVSTCIRIANDRDWNVEGKGIAMGQDLRPNGLGGYLPQGDEFEINLDLAYVTLKNFVYSPLTVTIGRQDLWFGKGFIVGSNHVYNNVAMGMPLAAPEYTTFTAFDSIKAVLDYDPWTITGVYSSIRNNTIASDDNIDLWGVNVGYKFDCYKAEAEAYWFLKRDRSIETWGINNDGRNDVNTIGIRGSMDPIENFTVAGEIAGQFGRYQGSTVQTATRPRAAWAMDLSSEWRGLMDKMAWKPKVGVEYVLYSGDQHEDPTADDTSEYNGWDPMFRGKFDSAIREFVGTYYASYQYQAQANDMPSCADASFTNQSQVIFSGTIQPMDCLTLKGNYNLFWVMEPYSQAAWNWNATSGYRGSSGFIGQEVDVQAIWDYTEDVSFGLLMGWFMPNAETYQNNNNAIASDIVGTVKVSF